MVSTVVYRAGGSRRWDFVSDQSQFCRGEVVDGAPTERSDRAIVDDINAVIKVGQIEGTPTRKVS
jgi:hypothetical protein